MNNFEQQYEYRRADGELIGYVCRFVDRGKKSFFPISYIHDSSKNINSWSICNFSNMLYRSEHLSQDKSRCVLIVEGEKAADIASLYLSNENNDHKRRVYDVISWKGGVNGIGTVDFSALTGREVKIWPDNDIAGYRAASKIYSKLRDISDRLEIINVRALDLPNKWDLGDLAAENSIDSSKQKAGKALNVESVFSILEDQSNYINQRNSVFAKENGFVISSKNNEILSSIVHNNLDKLIKEQKIDSASISEYKSRIDYELSIIEKQNCANNFIVAFNIVRYMKEENMEMNYGRGSSCASLTAYILGIHSIDPILHNLRFERFLDIKTGKIVDFDIDVSSSDKSKLEDFVFKMYQGKAFYMSMATGGSNQITRKHVSSIGIFDSDRSNYNIESFKDDLVYDHNTSEIRNLYPRLGKDLKIMDKDIVDNIIKIDLLSSNYLSKISVLKEKLKTENSLGSLIVDDKVKALLESGDTIGVFHLSSESARNILTRVSCENLGDISISLALNKPNMSKYIDHFSRDNLNRDQYQITDVNNILSSRVILYQEQIMDLGFEYFGIKQEELELFRKDFTKVSSERHYSRESLISAAKERGLSDIDASNLYESISEAASSGYSYSKAHACAYAPMVLESAYLKAHHGDLYRSIMYSSKDFESEHSLYVEKAIDYRKELLRGVDLSELGSFYLNKSEMISENVESLLLKEFYKNGLGSSNLTSEGLSAGFKDVLLEQAGRISQWQKSLGSLQSVDGDLTERNKDSKISLVIEYLSNDLLVPEYNQENHDKLMNIVEDGSLKALEGPSSIENEAIRNAATELFAENKADNVIKQMIDDALVKENDVLDKDKSLNAQELSALSEIIYNDYRVEMNKSCCDMVDSIKVEKYLATVEKAQENCRDLLEEREREKEYVRDLGRGLERDY